MSNLTQQSGDNSCNVQASNDVNITIVNGPSIGEMKQIAQDLFDANFYKLKAEAKDIACERATALIDSFLKTLGKENPQGLSQAKDPDFQCDLFLAQQGYARSGDEDLRELLERLLVDRSKISERNITQIVLNESLVIAPKLTVEHYAALSLIFYLKYTVKKSIKSQDDLFKDLDEKIMPLLPYLTKNIVCYQHLEYTSCVNINITSIKLSDILEKRYSGLFTHGFSENELIGLKLSIPSAHPLFIKCLNDPNKLQLAGINEEGAKEIAKQNGVSERDINNLIMLQRRNTPSSEGIMNNIIKIRPYVGELSEIYENSYLTNLTLTSVGIAIGHAFLKKVIGAFTDLEEWIK